MKTYSDFVRELENEEAYIEIHLISGFTSAGIKVSLPVPDDYLDKRTSKLDKLNKTLLKKQETLSKLNKDKVPKEVFDRLQGEIGVIEKDIEQANKPLDKIKVYEKDSCLLKDLGNTQRLLKYLEYVNKELDVLGI